MDSVVAADNRELQRLAIDAIRRAQATDPFAPVTLLVPGAAQGWALRRQIVASMPAGDSIANLRIVTATEFMRAAASAVDPTVQPTDRLVRSVAVEQLLAGETGPLQPGAAHKDTAQLLIRLADELAWCELSDAQLRSFDQMSTTTASAALQFVRRMRRELPTNAATPIWHELPSRITSDASVDLAGQFGTVVIVDQRLPSAVEAMLDAIDTYVPAIRIRCAPDAVLSGSPVVHSCPDPATEALIAVKAVVDALTNGVAPSRVAILYSSNEPYAALVEAELAAAGIEWHGPTSDSLSTLTLPRVAMLFAQMAAERTATASGTTRRDLMHWFAIGAMTVAGERVNVSRLRRFIRDENLYGDARRWRKVLADFERTVASEAAQEDARAVQRARSVETAKQLDQLLARIDHHLDRIATATTWEGLGIALHAAIDEFHLDPRWMSADEDERSSLTMLQNLLLRSFPRLDALTTSSEAPPCAQLPQLLERQFVGRRTRHGASAVGIHVGPISSARTLHFNAIALVGAMEGLLPEPSGSNPLLPEDARLALRSTPDDLPTSVERAQAAERDLHALLGAAQQVTVTFARAGLEGFGEGRCSRFFAHVPPMEQSSRLSTMTSTLPVNDLETAIQRALAEVPLDLQAQIANAHAWHRPVLGETFGAVPPSDLDGQTMSASGVEVFLHCPYNYFVSRMLNISTDQYPDDVDVISSSDFGTLLHDVFEEFVRTAGPSDLPEFGGSWPDGAYARLLGILEARVDKARESGTVGWLPAWDRQYDVVRDALPLFFDVDTRARSELALRPLVPEQGFGKAGPDVQLTLSDDTVVKFRGFIDRVDMSADRRKVGVMDYKSGSSEFFETSMKAVTLEARDKVQDLVYDLAARTLYPGVESVQVHFLFFPNDGQPKLVPAPDLDREALLRAILDRMQEAAKSGRFQPKPAKSRDFCPVCKLLGRRASRVIAEDEEEGDDDDD